jgi:hypothetical protein
MLTSQGVCRDGSRQAASKMIACLGAVVQEDHQITLRRTARLAFAVDDRDQLFIMRARVAFERPRVGS